MKTFCHDIKSISTYIASNFIENSKLITHHELIILLWEFMQIGQGILPSIEFEEEDGDGIMIDDISYCGKGGKSRV